MLKTIVNAVTSALVSCICVLLLQNYTAQATVSAMNDDFELFKKYVVLQSQIVTVQRTLDLNFSKHVPDLAPEDEK
jgi:hypothetical protein